MGRAARVVDVEHLGGHRLRLTFSDGLVRELDFEHVLSGGVFEPLKDRRLFAQVEIDSIAGTIRWPNGVDLDPDVLHGGQRPATGRPPKLLSEYHLHSAG
jgi:Protein of unknown function (DUF2442)